MKNIKLADFQQYVCGERVLRPWGEYVVTNQGITEEREEFCEKIITIHPYEILSLQSHNHRREHWVVKQGSLIVILNGKRLLLREDAALDIPQTSIHTMANPGPGICHVYERQEGFCREEDIIRYSDVYGRGTSKICDNNIKKSSEIYMEVLKEISKPR